MATQVLANDLPTFEDEYKKNQATQAALNTTRLLQEFTAEIRELEHRFGMMTAYNLKTPHNPFHEVMRQDLRRKSKQFARIVRALSQMNEHYSLEPHVKLEVEVRLADAESVQETLRELALAPEG